MYYIFMISNNYNQTLYSFQVVVYLLKMHKILTMYFKNTDAKYRYLHATPFSFFEIILPFFRNYLYMGWKFLRQIVPEKIDSNSLRK